MIFRNPIRAALLLGSMLFGLPAIAHAAGPNIVLILADDLGWGDVGCYNADSKIPTPHLDSLARQGIRFTDAHSSCAVCVPSRFSLMTGRHAFRMAGVPHPEPDLRARYGGNQPTTPLIPENWPTLARMLANAGYATAMVGKWHLGFDDLLRRPTEPLRGGPIDRGFGYYYGIPSSLSLGPYVFIENDRIVAQASEPMAAHASPGWPDDRMGEYWCRDLAAPGFRHVDVLPALTQQAEARLRLLSQASRTEPFFLYYAMPSPHTPLVPSPEFCGRTQIGIYGDYVAQADDAIGRLLRVLDDTGRSDDTLVIVTSDNGPFWYPENVAQTGHAASGPWRGMKGDAWEAGHRVPLIARWPGIVPENHVSDALVSLTDLLATVAARCGIEHDAAQSDGVDFSPALRGQTWTRPENLPLLVRSSLGGNVLRSGPWAYIDRLGSASFSKPQAEIPEHGGPAVQLYDLTADPGQRRNLAASMPDRAAELHRNLLDVMRPAVTPKRDDNKK